MADEHNCNWHNCRNTIPIKKWCCGGHWYRLPLQLRIRLERLYRPGSQDPELLKAEQEAKAWILANIKRVGGSQMQRRKQIGATRRWGAN